MLAFVGIPHSYKPANRFNKTHCLGKLRRIVSETAGAAETYLAHQLPDKYKAMATILGLLALLFIFDWRLGLLSLVPVILGFLCMTKMTGKSMQKKMTEYQNALSDMSNEAVEYVRGIPVVKTFGQTVFSFKKFKKAIDNYGKWTLAYTKELRGPMTAFTLAVNSVFAFLILGAFMFMSENQMIVKDALARVDEVLNAEPLSISEHPSHPKDNSVELKNVTYSYDGKKDALSDITLKIGACETVAFVGPSGGGKSTLACLTARFFDPQKGKVMIGGTDIRDIDKKELMNTVSFVFQNSRLIKASILENVKLGKPNASNEDVMKALKAAQCTDIIEKFPDGVDTVIGSKGVYRSGGEAQRIAIARAILKDSPIVILDEATAFADPDNEVKVQAAIRELSNGKTVIMIAHRLSTVANADKIFVLSDGKLAEEGKFDELRERGGLFSSMWNEYQKSVCWKVSKEA